ncbi:MAG: aldose 1-epimerase family protein [Maioricimonas sp. JB045]
MASQQSVLTDLSQTLRETTGTTVVDAHAAGLHLAGNDQWSVSRRMLHEGPSDGVEVVNLCNGPLTVSILPTRGMGIWKAEYRDIPVGWNSPNRFPVHPHYVNLQSRNGLGWLDGFNELLCRCGLAFNGPPGTDEDAVSPIESEITLHGRIANTAAHHVSVSIDDSGDGTISVRGEVDETTLFGPKLRLVSTVSSVAGSNGFTIVDEITNMGAAETELQLLYHTNIGQPFLEGNAQFLCPIKEACPRDARAAEGIDEFGRYLPPTPGYAEQAYFFDLLADDRGESLALLHNAAGDRGFSVRFDRQQLPCFTLWKCTQAEEDGYVTGLEPGINYPNFKADERRLGRVPRLAPGDTYRTSLSFEIHDSAESVSAVAGRIRDLQASAEPTIHREPVKPFCP